MSEEIAKPQTDIRSFGRSQTRIATSMDLTAKGNRIKMMACLNDCDARLAEEVNTIIEVTDYFIHDVDKLNHETGEVKHLERLVLICKDGTTHETTGATFIESLKHVCFAEGSPPWPNGVKLKVRGRKKNDRDIYFFEMVE